MYRNVHISLILVTNLQLVNPHVPIVTREAEFQWLTVTKLTVSVLGGVPSE